MNAFSLFWQLHWIIITLTIIHPKPSVVFFVTKKSPRRPIMWFGTCFYCIRNFVSFRTTRSSHRVAWLYWCKFDKFTFWRTARKVSNDIYFRKNSAFPKWNFSITCARKIFWPRILFYFLTLILFSLSRIQRKTGEIISVKSGARFVAKESREHSVCLTNFAIWYFQVFFSLVQLSYVIILIHIRQIFFWCL